MGKFDGKLLLSDYDNTLHYTEAALEEGTALPPIHPRNLEAVRYWMAQGGRFTVATGRALAAFRRQAEAVPMNAPAIVGNGAAIYDFAQGQYVLRRYLPEGALERLEAAAAAFPGISLEFYRENGPIQVLRPLAWNHQHAQLTGLPFQEVAGLGQVETPLSKILFVGWREELEQLLAHLTAQNWAEDYALIFSSDHMLEMTNRDATKGAMALELRELCGCKELICVGDHGNDLSMLRLADWAFAPANAIAEVRALPGIGIVCHCLDGALAEVVEALDRES